MQQNKVNIGEKQVQEIRSIMNNQVLRDRSGKRLGEIRERDGILEIIDFAGRRKGNYDPRTNVTRDNTGKVIGTGNLLTMLLSA